MNKNMICPTCWGSKQYPVLGAQCPTCHGDGVFPDLQLSDHFWLSEFLKSDTAARFRIDNSPSTKITAHLQQLAQSLEAIRQLTSALHISSGYRSDRLNTKVGSHSSSAHPHGWGADITAQGYTRKALVDEIAKSDLKFDQVIFEGTWVHFGLYKPVSLEQRKEILATYDAGGSYIAYDPNDPRLHT